jgi:hypothetical protein
MPFIRFGFAALMRKRNEPAAMKRQTQEAMLSADFSTRRHRF